MSELRETFDAMKLEARDEKAQRLVESTKLLKDLGISFQSHNKGMHLVVEARNGELIDFWPSTGRIMSRIGKVQKRGVDQLLKLVNPELF